jgi:hypothetical protein
MRSSSRWPWAPASCGFRRSPPPDTWSAPAGWIAFPATASDYGGPRPYPCSRPTGSPSPACSLIPAAQAAGVTRILVNHPNFLIGADPALCSSWAQQGVFIEHSLCHYIPESTFHRFSLDTLLEYVATVGCARTVLSSDLGQAGNPTPVEGFRWIVDALTAADVDAPTIRQLVGASARALVD